MDDEAKITISLAEAHRLWKLEVAVAWLLDAPNPFIRRAAEARVRQLLAEAAKPSEPAA